MRWIEVEYKTYASVIDIFLFKLDINADMSSF